MSADGTHQGKRSLAQIESDLLKAEQAFADADTRCKDAERERRAAFDQLNKHQAELDEAIAALRQRSIPGSNWHPAASVAAVEPICAPLKISEVEADSNRSGLTSNPADDSAAAEFDRLRRVVRFDGGNPLALEAAEDASADEIASKLFKQAANSAGIYPAPGFEFNRFRTAAPSSAESRAASAPIAP